MIRIVNEKFSAFFCRIESKENDRKRGCHSKVLNQHFVSCDEHEHFITNDSLKVEYVSFQYDSRIHE